MEINYVVILLCIVLTSFLLIKEVRRSDKSRLLWRILATTLMVISFALLIIPINYSTNRIIPKNEIALITEGVPKDTILAIKSAKINQFEDLMYYLKMHSEVKKVNIYGYGLSNNELELLKGYQLSFHPSTTPSGILSANWQKKLSASKQLIVQGIYSNPTNESVKLKFSGFGVSLDSLTIKANTKVNFSFSTQPKQIGKAVFNLIALQNRDTLSSEPIPFEVLPKEPINVLILASSPDFEYKFLKKWLYESENRIALRIRISKDKYSTEFLNRETVNLNSINQALLKQMDLVIADEEEVRSEIVSAVTNGMGLIVRAKAIKEAVNHQPLLRDGKGKITADSRLSGMGKIVATTIPSTYEWLLIGKQKEYEQFWSLLFAKALRKKVATIAYNIGSKWPTVNEKIRLTVSASNAKPPMILVDSNILALRQNMELPFMWDGLFWPRIPGWITLSNGKMYSYKPTEWKSAKNFDNLKATENFIASKPNIELKAGKAENLLTEQVNRLWFFLFFLIAISFLWYEQRFLTI